MSRTRGGRKRSAPESSGAIRRECLLVLRFEPRRVARQPDRGAVERDVARLGKHLQHCRKCVRRQLRRGRSAQMRNVGAGSVRAVVMKRRRAQNNTRFDAGCRSHAIKQASCPRCEHARPQGVSAIASISVLVSA